MKARKKIGILAGAAILALAHVGLALADENTWSTNGPYGASVQSIAIHPFDDQQIYIATVSGGIWQTTNGGADWSKIENDMLDGAGGIRVIKINPVNPDIIYAATNHGVFKSYDAGESWDLLPLPCPGCGYQALEINPGNPSIIYVEKKRSTDGGYTWEHIYDISGSVYDIVADQQNPSIVYAATNDWEHSIYKSTDYGETWESIHHNIPRTQGIKSRAIDIDPVDPQIIYLARDNLFIEPPIEDQCLFKSIDGGETWTDISPPGLLISKIVDVEVSPLDHNTVLACIDMDGAFRSTDAGQTWEPANQGTINLTPKTITFNSSGTAYLGFYFDGIYRSINNGDSWEKISNNISLASCIDIAQNWRNPDTLYTSTMYAFYMSTDGGGSWEYVDINLPNPNYSPVDVEVDPYDPNYIYTVYKYIYPNNIYVPGGLTRSTDGGSTWELFDGGLPQDRGYYTLAMADYGDGVRRLFMGSASGLFYSDDLGESWSLCPGLPPDIAFHAVDVSPVNPDIVFIGDYDSNDVFKSTDGGQTWEEITNNLPWSLWVWVTQIVCDPTNPDIIYVSLGDQYGIFKSTNGGQTWIDTNNNLPRPEYPHGFGVSGIAINPYNHNNVYVYSAWMGMFESYYGGQHWQELNEGLRMYGAFTNTLISPTNPDRLFIAQSGNSVWEITMTGGGDCVYIPGDCDHNGTPLELGDVIAMIGIYRGSVEPYYVCDCPPHGDTFAPEADPNGNCVAFELGDVVTEIGAYRGTAEASGCGDCPGEGR